jgi:hypothetical protein
MQRQDPPCEFTLISEDITLGASDVDDLEQNKLLSLFKDPTYLNYTFLDYNGADDLNIEVTLVDYEGNYELGKRDIGGTCIDFSTLKQRDIDDVC